MGCMTRHTLSPKQRRVTSHAHPLQEQTPQAQPLEPILFPKLRIYFVDFPYLHYSIDQRLLTLETCCGYEYDLARNSALSLGFSRTNRCAPDGKKSSPLYRSSNPISRQSDSRVIRPVKKKRELFPGQRLASPSSLTLPSVSVSRCGNINPLPFRHWVQPCGPIAGDCNRSGG